MITLMPKHCYLVLESVPSPFQVHVFSVGVVEAALTQFTVESNDLAIIVADLKEADGSGKYTSCRTTNVAKMILCSTYVRRTETILSTSTIKLFESWILQYLILEAGSKLDLCPLQILK